VPLGLIRRNDSLLFMVFLELIIVSGTSIAARRLCWRCGKL